MAKDKKKKKAGRVTTDEALDLVFGKGAAKQLRATAKKLSRKGAKKNKKK